jgi:hypothetical protein
LLLLVAGASADTIDVSQLPVVNQQQVDAANRFLSAEVGRQIRSANEETLRSLRDYQTENFMELDVRMTTVAEDMKKKLILGGIGAMLLSSGLVALVFMWITRRYSYEKYLEKYIADVHTGAVDSQKAPKFILSDERKERVSNEIQQREWEYGRPTQGLTATGVLTPAQAGNVTQFNEYQNDPAYAGSWVPQQGQGVYGQQQFMPQGQAYSEQQPLMQQSQMQSPMPQYAAQPQQQQAPPQPQQYVPQQQWYG